MIYLDNASTTHIKPRSVIKSVKRGATNLSVNSSRGGYPLSIDGGMEVLETRELIGAHFNCNPDNVIFTASCTASINLALRGTIHPNKHIISTTMEHNSTLRTLEDLKSKYNISYTLIKPVNGTIRPEDIENAITSDTYLVSTIHTSNVTGATNNVDEIGKICKKHNLIYMVDGAQSSGHIKVNIKDSNINLFTIAGHKGFYAPQGIGVLLINDTKVAPLITGGTGTFSESIIQPTTYPEGLESGTQSMPCILGLKAGVKYVDKNFEKINNKITKLSAYLLSYLRSNHQIEIYSLNPASGVISFNIKGYTSSEIGDYLSASYNICVRTGLHCAPLIHQHNNTLERGMVRVSISSFNKLRDIKTLIKALHSFTHDL